jgi:voltage-gated potassium channel
VLVSAVLLGTVGFMLVERWTLFDAFYMALITLTTVGYGEVHPLSFHGRMFASFLMLVGVATVFVSFAILGDTLLRLELTDYFDQRRRTRMLQHIAGHYIVCGAGRVGRSVVRELLRAGAKVVIIDNDPERVKWGEEFGILALTADASTRPSAARVSTRRPDSWPRSAVMPRTSTSRCRPRCSTRRCTSRPEPATSRRRKN